MTTTLTPPRPAVVRPATRPTPKPDADNSAAAGRMLAWLRLYWLTILFCGGLVGIGLSYLAWTLLASKYESYALLRVASSPFSVSTNKDQNRSRTDFATYLKTNSNLIKNDFVYNTALNLEVDGVRICDLATIKEQKFPLQFLDDEIVVSSRDGDEMVRISMKGHNPDDIRRIVNAIQQAFMQEVVERELNDRKAFLVLLEKELVALKDTLNAKVGKPKEVEHKEPNALTAGGLLPAGGPLAGPPEYVKKQYAQVLVAKSLALQEQLNDLPMMIAAQQARIAMFKKQLEQPTAAPADAGPSAEMLDAAADRDPDVKALEEQEKRVRREYALDLIRYSNPNVPSIAAKLERADQLGRELTELKKKKHTLYAQMKTGSAGTPPAVVAKIAEYDAAVLKLYDLQLLLDQSKARLPEVQKAVAALPPDFDPVKPVDYRRKDDKKNLNPDDSQADAEDSIFRGLAQNAAALRLDLGSPRRVTIQQQASSPIQKDTKKQLLGTAFAGLLGFAVVGLVAVGYELKVKKTCGLADVKTAGGTPVVGVIPWQNAASLTQPVRRAEIVEAVDRLRAYVTQTWLPRGATTVTVTSPFTDEGKSYTAFALANGLADAGYKTLLVDFDLRLPTLHALAGLDNAAGICELLRGEADFKQTIKVLPNSLHVLPAGKWSDDARRAAGSGRLEQLLKCLREPFDCVILHSHPLLTAAESIEVARRSEVVLLCTLCRETTLPLLKKATDRLQTMEVPYTGIVYLGATPQEALC